MSLLNPADEPGRKAEDQALSVDLALLRVLADAAHLAKTHPDDPKVPGLHRDVVHLQDRVDDMKRALYETAEAEW